MKHIMKAIDIGGGIFLAGICTGWGIVCIRTGVNLLQKTIDETFN